MKNRMLITGENDDTFTTPPGNINDSSQLEK
jgi:hypothetical protein